MLSCDIRRMPVTDCLATVKFVIICGLFMSGLPIKISPGADLITVHAYVICLSSTGTNSHIDQIYFICGYSMPLVPSKSEDIAMQVMCFIQGCDMERLQHTHTLPDMLHSLHLTTV